MHGPFVGPCWLKSLRLCKRFERLQGFLTSFGMTTHLREGVKEKDTVPAFLRHLSSFLLQYPLKCHSERSEESLRWWP